MRRSVAAAMLALVAAGAVAAGVGSGGDAAGLHWPCHGDPLANEAVRSARLAEVEAQGNGRPLRLRRMSGEIVVPIQFHVVRRSDGVGGLSAAELEDEFDRLNDLFAPADIRFCLAGPTRFIDSDSFFLQTTTLAQIDALRMTDPAPNAVNAYYVPFLAFEPFGEILGVSSITAATVQGIVMSNRTALESVWRGVLAHEAGHYFDLYHTFETVFGLECPSGSNCGFAGDLVCDTPADPGVFAYSGCQWIGSAAPRCGSSNFNPPGRNLMNYTGGCMNDFTPGQIIRMRETIQFLRPELMESGCAVFACSPADVTGVGVSDGVPDGLVTLSDFSFYLSLWASGDAMADVTPTGTCDPATGGGDGVDLSDFSCYLSVWSAGCP